jgi:uncharacterized protein DUF3179
MVDGRRLNFHLAGINNQNFIMRDEETGSWWQQVTGEAIQGPLKGKKLDQVTHDELNFATWKREQPGGRVLRPAEAVADRYAPKDWAERIGKWPTVTPADSSEPLAQREIVIGIELGGQSKAYPLLKIKREKLLHDTLGGVSFVVAVGDDGESVRVFERSVDGRALEFFAVPNLTPLSLVDSDTGSRWDFAGKALGGPMAGRRLKKITALKDFWFDWKIYHPDTAVY